MSLLNVYHSRAASGLIEADPAQARIAARLEALIEALKDWRPRGSGLTGLFRKPTAPPKGLYVHGPVGRGKTMLMDLFFSQTEFQPKRRLHFHEFMGEVHQRIGVARKTVGGDPLPTVAAALAKEARLLCFDELHVTDIADAMILGRLFKGMLEADVVIVATSNVPPSGLYKDGLNRALFLPFIDLIEQHLDVEELKAAKDFRLEKLAGRPLYFSPLGPQARAEMDKVWMSLTGVKNPGSLEIEVLGRKVVAPRAAMGVARFAFADLCEKPLGANDFLALAHAFHTLMIDDIPVLRPAQRNEARRFVNLIDTLYDNKVGLVASAAAEPDHLYPPGDVSFLFERTASRLIEMRSEDYLAGRENRQSTRAAVPETPSAAG
ncbi:MAG: cell division protein ZapE [Hyphomicrobiales bacterium]|nr:MAG: cell division protein ZapE [Hyphomicrobiales bacterium]